MEPLPNLKSLILWSGLRASYGVGLLAHLTLPSLETLALECSFHSWMVSPFLSRSKCTLRHFSFLSRAREEFPSVEEMPMLSTLEIFEYPQQLVSQLLRYLKGVQEDGMLSHLEKLSFSVRQNEADGTFPFARLLTLLEAMSGTDRPTALRRFHLRWTTVRLPRMPDAQEIRDFRKLRDGGMDIYVGDQRTSWV
jgi:hypothetical protein